MEVQHGDRHRHRKNTCHRCGHVLSHGSCSYGVCREHRPGTGNEGHPGMTKDQNYQSQLVKLRADIAAGDQEKVNRDVEALIEEILSETPMAAAEMQSDVPESPSATQGRPSQRINGLGSLTQCEVNLSLSVELGVLEP